MYPYIHWFTINAYSASDFEYSSNRRVTTFNISISDISSAELFEVVDIDGVGRLSHPLELRARRQVLSSMDADAQESVKTTQAGSKDKLNSNQSDIESAEVMLLEDSKSIGDQVEQWALEYTSKFIHAAGPDFYSTTIAQIIGTAYVKKGLPEVSSDLLPSLLARSTVILLTTFFTDVHLIDSTGCINVTRRLNSIRPSSRCKIHHASQHNSTSFTTLSHDSSTNRLNSLRTSEDSRT